MQWIKDKIAAAWAYSRTIFLNVVSFLTLGGTELLAYALNANWASVISNPKALFGLTMLINVANVYLRTQTTAPVGEKPVEGS